MNIGYRIKSIRQLRGLTQKELGMKLGYSEKTADIRVSQYESGTRFPKEDTIKRMADILEVSSGVFSVPHIDNVNDVIQILFALEDMCGLRANFVGEQFCLSIEGLFNIVNNNELLKFFKSWKFQYDALAFGGISKDQYDNWRYNYTL